MALPLKIALLVLTSISQYIGVMPPNPPAGKDDKILKKGLINRATLLFGLMSQFSFILCQMTECVLLLSLSFKDARASKMLLFNICPGSPSLMDLSKISPQFLLGISGTVAGVTIRRWCFKTLGRLFTYEITIRRNHELVTSGPYAYVRHPSYVGAVLTILGPALLVYNSHSYIWRCNIMSTPARWVIVVWAIFEAWVCIVLVNRGKTEDQILKANFGKTWTAYRRQVPYKFIPGLV
ncbi:ICMT-domain-containing protein [Ramaria rubella]|nr:ICMT-domain-containing protein [Ramaria rubella]